jgi:acyl carrier protein
VRQAAAVVREDRPGDRRLVAYVVAESGAGGATGTGAGAAADEPTPPGLRDALRGRLPAYMLPSAIVLLDALPLTPSGKLDRRALPAPDARQVGLAYVAPRGPTEETVAAIWRGLLGVERIGVHDDFFELGGHSLLAMRVTSRLRDAFGIQVPVQRLFEDPTVAGLAEYVDTLLWAAGDDATRPWAPDGVSPGKGDAPDDEEVEL